MEENVYKEMRKEMNYLKDLDRNFGLTEEESKRLVFLKGSN